MAPISLELSLSESAISVNEGYESLSNIENKSQLPQSDPRDALRPDHRVVHAQC